MVETGIKKAAMPQDFKKSIDWIVDAYDLAKVTLCDGFQKDVIQNASGARAKDSWKNWKCKIDFMVNTKGTFLVIEDEGTEGLTGPNLSASEIMQIIDRDEEIDSSWRLARFSSRNVSGGVQTGAGKYGVGKSVYSAASITYDYCFDSLRKDGVYVANRNEAGQIFEKAFENDEAKKYIAEVTGLKAKEQVGTRIIILNPKEEITEGIQSGEMRRYIQENWWRCIEKMPDNAGIYLNGERVDSPEFAEFEKQYELPRAETFADGYRVKKFGFFIDKKGSETGWHGVSYYRMGMKIGTVDLVDIPKSISDRFWGYLEVDKEWEERLADIEDAVHYGVKAGKKHTTVYQNMRLFISQKVNGLLIGWKYIKDKEYEDKKLQEALKEISSELQDLFDKMGFEDLGKGPRKPDYMLRWKNIKYPHEESATVLTGDSITAGFQITSDYLTERKFNYTVDIISKRDGRIISSIMDDSVKIAPGTSFERAIIYEVTPLTAERYEENRIVLTVKVSGSTKEKRKELPFFYDTEKEDRSRREVILTLHSMEKPREDSYRVDFGDKISKLTYMIQNKRSHPLFFSLNISLHKCEEKTSPMIKEIARVSGSATPYEEVLMTEIPDILFLEEELSPYLDSGAMEIRARLVATEDSDEYEKGDKITQYFQKIYLNKDEKSGKEGAFEPMTQNDPDNYRRSWCKAGNRQIIINSGHPAYKASQSNDEDWKSYMKQEMLRQYVLLYLEEGRYEMFGNGSDITEMDPIDASRCIMDKIEEVYQNSFS